MSDKAAAAEAAVKARAQAAEEAKRRADALRDAAAEAPSSHCLGYFINVPSPCTAPRLASARPHRPPLSAPIARPCQAIARVEQISGSPYPRQQKGPGWRLDLARQQLPHLHDPQVWGNQALPASPSPSLTPLTLLSL